MFAESIVPSQLDKHVEEVCPKTKVPCEYEDIGCEYKVCFYFDKVHILSFLNFDEVDI